MKRRRIYQPRKILLMAAFLGLLSAVVTSFCPAVTSRVRRTTTYYIDSQNGNDQNNGTGKKFPWKTFERLTRTRLYPGDSVLFKRGSAFIGPLIINDSGRPGSYIVFSSYGSNNSPAPAFTNPVFKEGNYGNGIRIKGSYVVVENLYFHNTAAYATVRYNGEGWAEWEMGAIHIDSTAQHCIIRNNEIENCVAGIRSNGQHTLIEYNYIHDCNRVLKEWNWGPLGIWLGADYQEVRYNRIFNYSAVDPRINWGPDAYGGGADGGAMEIDDARNDKAHISIHHNYTRNCQGFLEVTWTDVKQKPAYKNFEIHHNISDDYQQFIALWQGQGCRIENNTIIRRKVNANDWGVFNITQFHSRNIIRNNIIVTEKDIRIFNLGKKGKAQPQNIISHNLYFAASGSLNMGLEGPGDSAVFGNPLFKNYEQAQSPADFSLTASSPAIDRGIGAGYEYDFVHTSIPQNKKPDIGAFEFQPQSTTGWRKIRLAANKNALAAIVLAAPSSLAQQYAAKELRHYLNKISGAVFNIKAGEQDGKATIALQVDEQLPIEDYTISIRNQDIILAGGSDRALLYAAYDFLKQLGCCWLAPQFSFYNGFAEYVPYKPVLEYEAGADRYEHPAFTFRKLDVEEGRSHNLANLKQMIEWMPKVRLNTFMVPLNYQGSGKVQWDNWRNELVPELKKRGLLIEVGGHGYQNFLNAGMEDGTLFKNHPDWFGRNKNGEPDPAKNLVFNTSNDEAVDYLVTHLVNYITAHPEIDIFDFWPPDVARWAETPAWKQWGSPADRQATLVNKVNREIKKINPRLRLEIIAYGQVLEPSQNVSLDSSILVDICPINQSFEQPLFRSDHPNNKAYAKTIEQWRKVFTGAIGLYSYYRKYAWRSLPVILPHYMQQEMKDYAQLPLQGISTYAEPGDWFTYELNHYALAALAWNPNVSIEALLDRYFEYRYGPAKQIAADAYSSLERLVRVYSSIPYSTLKPLDEIKNAQALLLLQRNKIDAALAARTGSSHSGLSRLLLMMDYAIYDMDLLEGMVSGRDEKYVSKKLQQLVQLLGQNSGIGIFLTSGNTVETLQKHYAARAAEMLKQKRQNDG
jgi:hypothetical protein